MSYLREVLNIAASAKPGTGLLITVLHDEWCAQLAGKGVATVSRTTSCALTARKSRRERCARGPRPLAPRGRRRTAWGGWLSARRTMTTTPRCRSRKATTAACS